MCEKPSFRLHLQLPHCLLLQELQGLLREPSSGYFWSRRDFFCFLLNFSRNWIVEDCPHSAACYLKSIVHFPQVNCTVGNIDLVKNTEFGGHFVKTVSVSLSFQRILKNCQIVLAHWATFGLVQNCWKNLSNLKGTQYLALLEVH